MSELLDNTVPEIQRTNLSSVVLLLKSLDLQELVLVVLVSGRKGHNLRCKRGHLGRELLVLELQAVGLCCRTLVSRLLLEIARAQPVLERLYFLLSATSTHTSIVQRHLQHTWHHNYSGLHCRADSSYLARAS